MDEPMNTVISNDNTNIQRGGTYTIAKNFTGIIMINTAETVTIDGKSAGDLKNVKIVAYQKSADLKIKNLNVTNESGSVVTFGDDKKNKLTILGTNDLKTEDTWAAVVNIGGGLTIDGTGSLFVTATGAQGSGIGYNSYRESKANLKISGGTITATSDGGAAIGSGLKGSIGNITISGGIITATSVDGAAIGSGLNGSAENVIISGGTITATSDMGAAIGSGWGSSIGNITVSAGTIKVTSEDGAGIGSGVSGTVKDILINGNTKIIATSDSGMGIGAGVEYPEKDVTVGNITISGKSSVLITQMDRQTSYTGGATKPSEVKINGIIYTDQQLMFEKGVKKNLTERIILKEIIQKGSDKADEIFEDTNWYSAATIKAGKGNDTIHATGPNFLIYAGEGDDSIYSGSWSGLYDSEEVGGNVTLYSGNGNDYVESNSNNSYIELGKGNDSIRIYSTDKVTINGGKGNDYILNSSDKVLFKYTKGDGNDLIEGFNSTSTLSISGGSYTATESGSDVIVTVGKGKITLEGAEPLSTVNIQGTAGGLTTLIVTNSTRSPVTVGSSIKTIKTINAASRTKAVKITGNRLANTITGGSGSDTIYGGKGNDSILGGKGADKLYGQTGNDILKGGKGNDSLWGGAGNDSLWGGSGNDTFIYTAGEGTDKIFDYQSGDMLKILNGKFSKSKYSGGTLSLTISGGGQIIFDNVTTSTNFNINGTSYKISGSKLVKK